MKDFVKTEGKTNFSRRLKHFDGLIVNSWNSLPDKVVVVDAVKLSKCRLHKFWMQQEVKYDYNADNAELTGTGN